MEIKNRSNGNCNQLLFYGNCHNTGAQYVYNNCFTYFVLFLQHNLIDGLYRDPFICYNIPQYKIIQYKTQKNVHIQLLCLHTTKNGFKLLTKEMICSYALGRLLKSYYMCQNWQISFPFSEKNDCFQIEKKLNISI